MILGCGNLGNIILDGFSKKGKKVIVFEKNKTIKKNLKKKDVLTVNNLKDVKWERIEYVMICVKPIDSIGLLNQLKENMGQQLLSWKQGKWPNRQMGPY